MKTGTRTTFVILTQIQENYGAHSWDGQGECPSYWKFKGGESYVCENFEDEKSAIKAVEARCSYDHAFKEYVCFCAPLNDWLDTQKDTSFTAIKHMINEFKMLRMETKEVVTFDVAFYPPEEIK
jgi:hypothetical protein